MIHSRRKVRFQEIDDTDDLSLDLTPLIDIVFIIIVFLLMTAAVPLMKLQVDIPSASENPSAQKMTEKTLVITIPAETIVADWHVNDMPLANWQRVKEYLLDEINKAHKYDINLQVSVASDRYASAENLIKVMSFLNEHDIENIQILMSQSNG